MAIIQGFRDLHVYQAARKGSWRIYLLTQKFPKLENYSLTDQIRRSSRAVGGIVAEGWGRRRYQTDFILKMTQALGEAMETPAWLDSALDAQYITTKEHLEHDREWQQVGGMLNRTIAQAATFCLKS